MAAVLQKWMTLALVLNFMFAPILAYVDSLHREAVEVVLHEGAKKAAIEGRFTEDIVKSMRSELVNNYNFDSDKIEINATQSLTYRNEYMDASIEVPRGPIFLFEIFIPGPKTIHKNTRVLSEYIN
ncbi:hypothetical protein [Terribacillus saccharophilus]|uniref:hypothetical protein n=1 Tax=Terribacillus saccharophilus TaxID=361277 RepID=UPI003D2C1AA4